MKKILAALSLIALLFTACKETETPVTVDLSENTATEVTTINSHSHMMVTVSNTTDNEATIQWEHSVTTPVTGWIYTINGSTMASGTLTIPANGSVDVTLMVMPDGVAGAAAGMLKFYDAKDQALSMQTFSYTVTTVTQYFELINITPTSQSIRPNDPDTDYKMKIYNPSNADINVNWTSTMGTTNPSSWVVDICDPFQCFPPGVLDGSFPVPAGDSVDFKFTFKHGTTSGNGTATANFFIATDSLNSLTSQMVDHTVQ
ncbi:MAG: Unknown protein [uncultured Aureispira sp.]|uniref:BACON domain-containing protein n=1 Tax=uncultured Aureispira sp. TaxID=1331704 RepID=A0A6S6S7F1_9BACT|nr:MAG: Unknown protein [uncultured Aureispira sp.]